MTQSMAVVIAGPTASGKSHVALRLADALPATIINADAMQVYADLNVLTARPSAADMAAVPHRLYGTVDGAVAFSVAQWRDAAAGALSEAWESGRIPIVVGGTGMYIASLFEGLAPIPAIPDAVRGHWRARQQEAPERLYDELTLRDPLMAAKLRPSDPQRIVRALEVVDATGRSLAEWQSAAGPALLGDGAVRLVIAPERSWLRDTIATRFEAMVQAGAVEEAARLWARGLPADRPVMKAIGVQPLAEAARGECLLDDAVARSITQTRQYAKRQETWFRHRFAGWPRSPRADDGAAAILSDVRGRGWV